MNKVDSAADDTRYPVKDRFIDPVAETEKHPIAGKAHADFALNAPKPSPAEELGIGQAAYEELYLRQRFWEEGLRRGLPNISIVSPMEWQREQNLQLQQALKKDDASFAQLKVQQSKWEDQRDSGGPFSKSSPFDLARMQAGIGPDNQPLKPVAALDFGAPVAKQ